MKLNTGLAVGTILSLVAVMVLFIIAIWTGDSRWGWTGGVMLAPLVILGLILSINDEAL